MVEFVHFSDLHIGSGDHREEWIQATIDYINDSAVDFAVCTGDLTDKGRMEQFKQAARLLKEIEKPLICVPGNHDVKNNGLTFYEQLIGPRRSRTVLEDLDTIVLGIKSPKPDLREGEVGDSQLEWIIKSFKKYPLENRVMALHHHLIAVPDAGQRRDVVSDAGDVLALTQAFQVDVVLCGHKHVPHAWVIGPTTFLYCGTTASEKFRHDEPPSFNHVLLDREDLEIGLVSAADLDNRQPLLVRKGGRTRFIRPRKFRIEHLRDASELEDREWSYDPREVPRKRN